MKVVCRHCGRYVLEAKGTTIIEGIICANSKCKAKLNIKVVTASSSEKEIRHTFSTPEVPPRSNR